MLASAGLMSGRDAKGANPPEAPTGLDAEQDSSTSALVTWEDNSDREDDYVIYRQVDGGGFSEYTTVGADVESYTDTNDPDDNQDPDPGLSKGSTYEYKVAAKNEAGESSQAGPAGVTIEDVPAQPNRPVITAVSDTQLDLSWIDNASDEDEYKVQEQVSGSWTTIATLPADSTSYSHIGLNEGTTHNYRIQACNELAGCSTSLDNDGTTKLSPPTNFLAEDKGSYAHLTWTDNSGKEQEYEVYRDGSSYTTVSANTEELDVPCPEGEGTFKVRAIHSSIPDSDFSAQQTGVSNCVEA